MTVFSRLTSLLTRTAARGWPVLFAGSLALVSFRVLRLVGRAFQRHTAGHEPFDFQNRLTAVEVAAQLPAYTSQSRRWYRVFFAADLVFPLMGPCSWDWCGRGCWTGRARGPRGSCAGMPHCGPCSPPCSTTGKTSASCCWPGAGSARMVRLRASGWPAKG